MTVTTKNNKVSKVLCEEANFLKQHGRTPQEKNETTLQSFYSAQTSGSQLTMDQSFVSSGTLKAEIIWVLKSVVINLLYMFTEIFSIILLNSDITKGIL